MGIRGRFLLFAVAVSVPLATLGVIALLGIWKVSRRQLDDSVKQQSELAAIAYDRWIDGQREPLTTLAAAAGEKGFTQPAIKDEFRRLRASRPFWGDVSLITESRQVLAIEPANADPLAPALIDRLLSESREHNSWALVADRTAEDELRSSVAIAAPMRSGDFIVARIDGAAINELFRQIQLREGSVLAVFDDRDRLLYRKPSGGSIDQEMNAARLLAALGSQQSVGVEVESPYDGIRRIYGMARTPTTGSVVVIGIPTANLYQPARRRLMLYLIFSLLICAGTLAVGVFIARSITRPISELGRTAAAFGANDLQARVTVKSSGDLADLGIAFNRMADQISEREEKLKELDRLKSEFVSSVSHELRTPLTTIKTLTYLLQKDGLTRAEQREHLGIMAAECDREINLVLKLLDLSRIESGNFRPHLTVLRPAEIVIACERRNRAAAEAGQQEFNVEVGDSLPAVSGDRAGIERALGGLIENAIKYTPAGGRITLRATQKSHEIAFQVSDTGVGIRPEDISRIFDRFYRGAATLDGRVSQAGIGLGLYLVRKAVENMGGRVEVESTVEVGTTFTIYLPIVQGSAEQNNESLTEDLNGEEVAGRR